MHCWTNLCVQGTWVDYSSSSTDGSGCCAASAAADTMQNELADTRCCRQWSDVRRVHIDMWEQLIYTCECCILLHCLCNTRVLQSFSQLIVHGWQFDQPAKQSDCTTEHLLRLLTSAWVVAVASV
jgi:hypothetical protein